MNNSYFCTKCKRKHREKTAVHEKHLKWREIETDETPSNKLIRCNIKRLSGIAQRQIDTYLNKLVWDKRYNLSKNRGMYIQQINKIILSETNNMLTI